MISPQAPEETPLDRGARVLFVAPAPTGGTVQYTHNLANALAGKGHGVMLATGIGFELAAHPRHYRLIEVFDRFTPHFRRLAAFLGAVRRFRPDIVHFQGAQHPEFYLLLWVVLRALTPARFVWTPQDVLSNTRRRRHMVVYRLVYGRMRHVFLNARQNEAAIADLFGVDRRRISVLPIPDLVAFVRRDLTPAAPDLPAGRRLVLCFGLIEPRKGIDTLIEAFARIRARVPDAYLLVTGKALTDVAPYRAAIDRLGLAGDARIDDRYVSFEEMAGLFERAHVITLPYHHGWNSGVLASAFGFGKPVVATTVGGFEEVVADGRTGLLVPPRDPQALAAALLRTLDDPGLHARLSDAAAREGARTSWDGVAGFTAEIYAGLCVPAGHPAVGQKA